MKPILVFPQLIINNPFKTIPMKQTITIGIVLAILTSCGNTTEQTPKQASAMKSSTIEANDKLPAADYSSLLIDFTCDMNAIELAQAMGIPAADLVKTTSSEQLKKTLGLPDADMDKLAKNPLKNERECTFELKGYGVDNLGNDMLIRLQSTEMTKADVKKNINSQLQNREDGIEKITKIYITKADTDDSYIVSSVRYGRVMIYNEDHAGVFVISYGTRNANNNRTKEQHEALTQKMVTLANALLKKHRK